MTTWNLIRTLFYLQLWSRINKLKARLRRLKQPRYLIGAIVGLGYLYLWLGRFVLRGWWGTPASSTSFEIPGSARTLIEGGAATILLVIVAALWIFTGSRAALQFSEAELAFLLPAPISRRMLVRYKLLRGQVATLISAGFVTLFTGRFAAGGRVVFHILGWWLVLTLLNLHSIASSFTVQRLTERGLASWVRRVAALGVVAGLLAAVVMWMRMLPALPEFAGDPRVLAGNLAGWAELALTSGPGPWLLLPFRWAVHPWFAPGGVEFLQALGPALLLLAIHYWWVERADVSFEEASLALSEKHAQILAAARAGKVSGLAGPRKKGQPPFALAPSGPPLVGLMWKNLIATGTTPRYAARIAGVVIALSLAVRFLPLPPAAPVVASTVAMLVFLALTLMGGSYTSGALRRSLGMMDSLKGYPLPGWQLVLGEMLGPAAFISAMQALVVLTVLLTLPPMGEDQQFPWIQAFAAAVAAVLTVIPLNFVNAIVPSAALLLFPAWAKPEKDIQQQGFEATGQRLVFVFAQIAVMILSLAPAAGLALGVFFLINSLLGVVAGVLSAGLLAAVALAVEAWFGIRLLGRLFDQYDASLEQ